MIPLIHHFPNDDIAEIKKNIRGNQRLELGEKWLSQGTMKNSQNSTDWINAYILVMVLFYSFPRCYHRGKWVKCAQDLFVLLLKVHLNL